MCPTHIPCHVYLSQILNDSTCLHNFLVWNLSGCQSAPCYLQDKLKINGPYFPMINRNWRINKSAPASVRYKLWTMLLLNSLVAHKVIHVIGIFFSFFAFPPTHPFTVVSWNNLNNEKSPTSSLLQGKTKQGVKQKPWSELERKTICRPKWHFP